MSDTDWFDPSWLKVANVGQGKVPPQKALEKRVDEAAFISPTAPNFRDVMWEGASAADWLGRHLTSRRCYEEILKTKWASAEAHYGRSLQLLTLGQFAEGWKEYLYLYKTEPQLKKAKGFPQPWDGLAKGDGILVFSDQGDGDAIMALRYIPRLRDCFARVFLFCGENVADLARTTGYFDDVIPTGGLLTSKYGCVAGLQCQYSVPIMALPAHFRAFTRAKPPVPGYFKIDPGLTLALRDKFDGGKGYRVGLAWRGKPGTPRDRIRSFDSSRLEPIVKVPGATFFSLQWEVEDGEIDCLGDGVINLWPHMNEWRREGNPWSLLETAAFIASLDLVITCDSATAHVAGALDVPTWIALPFASEWRWGLGNNTGWYPKSRLFRQPKYGEWEPVFASIASRLKKVVAEISITQ